MCIDKCACEVQVANKFAWLIILLVSVYMKLALASMNMVRCVLVSEKHVIFVCSCTSSHLMTSISSSI